MSAIETIIWVSLILFILLLAWIIYRPTYELYVLQEYIEDCEQSGGMVPELQIGELKCYPVEGGD